MKHILFLGLGETQKREKGELLFSPKKAVSPNLSNS